MRLEQLKPNIIVRGAIFPEPVQVIVVVPMGDSVKLIGKGLYSGKVHEPILNAEQLATLESTPENEPFDGDPHKFRLGIEALRLELAYEYDPYFSLSIARVDPLPHQLEAVYDYFIKLPRIRFLLADDPGAGKTIMAGLLIKELKIRGLVKRTLIVTPANLSFQWQREMKDKFRENFEIVRSDVLRANYGTNPWQEKNQVITSVSWVSRIEDAKESLLRTHWDLVIVDEAPIYGMMNWGDLFSARQALALTILAAKVRQVADHFKANPIGVAVQTLLGFALDRQADYNSSVCRWVPAGEFIGNTFGRQAIPMVWDFCEVSVLSKSTGGFSGACDWIVNVLEREASAGQRSGHVEIASAARHPLPSDAAHAFITDPPYYDAVPYAHLADFFYVWLKRSIGEIRHDLFAEVATPKADEIVVDRPHELSNSTPDIAFYERQLTKAFAEGRRVLRPDGIATIVFASKTTASWEAILKAVVDTGWIITGSWPIDTEMEARVSAQGQARLASSVHLICRPRENADGCVRMNNIGDWRDVLHELPRRIHEWMPRLSEEGVVGADAIFACLGPALGIYSRYSRVEKASGEAVTLKEYLEHVWATVAKHALVTILEGADASGFEEDARLRVIWFWVMKAAEQTHETDAWSVPNDVETGNGSEDDAPTTRAKIARYSMEYDAVRKLAQGLGADLHKLSRPGGVLTIQGNMATLNSVESREQTLIGKQLSLLADLPNKPAREAKDTGGPGAIALKAVTARKTFLFAEKVHVEADTSQLYLPSFQSVEKMRPLMDRLLDSGVTVLDRLHQAMLLFGRSQTALLGPFLQETRMAHESRFWQLAQALSALYPSSTDEKRWVDGVLARKKGLGF